MSLSVEDKAQVVEKYQRNPKDNGSAAVQVALITSRLEYLQKHFESHKKDFHSQRGLLKLVGRRRRLLDYMRATDIQQYRSLIEQLGIRK